MKAEIFDPKIGAAQARLESLRQRLDEAAPSERELLADSFEELSIALTELEVAMEQLRQTNDQLAASQQALEAERQHYQELFEFTPDGYLVTDLNGTIQEANLAAAALLQAPQEFLVGKPLIVFVAEEEHKEFYELLRRLRQGEKVERWEAQFQPRPGAPFPASLRVSSIRGAKGSPIGLRWLVLDITEHKRANEALRESNAMFEGLFDSAPDAVVAVNGAGRIARVNARTEALFGYSREELLGKPVEVLLPERFRERHAAHRLGYSANPPARPMGSGLELYGRRKDGSEFPVDITLGPLKTSEGVVIVSVVRDITERKKAELRLHMKDATARALAESATVTEVTPKILQSLCEALGWDRGEIWAVDQQVNALRCVEVWQAPSVELPRFGEMTRQTAFAPGEGLPGRVWASGEPEWVANVLEDKTFTRRAAAAEGGLHSAFALPIGIKGEVLGVMAFLSRDIHQPDDGLLQMFASIGSQMGQFIKRRQAEEDLRKAHDELEKRVEERTAELARANEALRQSGHQLRNLARELEEELIVSHRLVSVGELAASFAHEFNNPLAVILGFAQDMASDIEPSHPHYKALKIIEEQTSRCKNNIKALLEFARPVTTSRRRIGLQTLVRQSLAMIGPGARKLKVQTALRLGRDLPQIYADPQQLEQVLLNLFFNALEAMPKGGKLTVRVAAADSENGAPSTVLISVKDTGKGIDGGDLPGIFRPFYSTKKKGGMGLGLSICQSIIRAHGGRIEVESAPGQGAAFHIRLPVVGERIARESGS